MLNERKRKAFRRLTELLVQIDGLRFSMREDPTFKTWQLNVETALSILFGDKSIYLKEFKDVTWSPFVLYSGMDSGEWERSFDDGRERARGILTAAISAAEDYGDHAVVQTVPDHAGAAKEPPSSLPQAVLREVWSLHPAVRITLLTLAVVILTSFGVLSVMTDAQKERLEKWLFPDRSESAPTTKLEPASESEVAAPSTAMTNTGAPQTSPPLGRPSDIDVAHSHRGITRAITVKVSAPSGNLLSRIRTSYDGRVIGDDRFAPISTFDRVYKHQEGLTPGFTHVVDVIVDYDNGTQYTFRSTWVD